MFRREFVFALLTVIILLGAVVMSYAQGECDVDATKVINIVDQTCGGIGRDEVCYGNYEVNVVAQASAPKFVFDTPGNMTSLGYIRSLFLSALDPEKDIWGIAQMRLFAKTDRGAEDIILLLFGDVSVEDATEPTTTFDVVADDGFGFSVNIRNVPSLDGLVLNSVPSKAVLEAVGRLEDTSWIRVKVPNSDAVGWIAGHFVEPVNDADNLEMLAIQDGDKPYYGPMQAFYYNSGGNTSCSNMMSDGLLIQTPHGTARVNLLINEVSIEFISLGSGTTAFIQANPQDGMTISMLEGTAVVEANGGTTNVNTGLSTNIALNSDLSASGTPHMPSTIDVDEISSVALLPVVIDPAAIVIPTVPPPTIDDTIIVINETGTADGTASTGTTTGTSTTGTATGTGTSSGGSTTGTGSTGSGGGSSSGGSSSSHANCHATSCNPGNKDGGSSGNANGSGN